LKEIYIYNYLKSYNTVKKWYKEDDSKVFYATYLMIGKLTIAFIYPLIRLLEFISPKIELSYFSKLFFLLIAIIFFSLDYFLIRKRFDRIVNLFNKKTENEVAKLRLYDFILKFIIIILNLVLIFLI